MLASIKTDKVLFLDIETVPIQAGFSELPLEFQEFWDKKSQHFRKENQTAEDVFDRAGIYAEFGKVICISFGIVYFKRDAMAVRLKSIYGEQEKTILTEFAKLLTRMDASRDLILCAHNGKEFDFPYLSRRMLINGVQLPSILDIAGRKPWETQFLDTMELWKFGDFKNYTSLNLLAHLFGIPSPKSDIDGSQVASVYWKDHDLERISKYCQNDVLAIVQLYLKFKGEAMIAEENIEFVL
jgi:3'-5' exonuclease